MPTYIRCPNCELLTLTAGECMACGFTGICSVCAGPVDPTDAVAGTLCSEDCRRESVWGLMGDEAYDAMVDMELERGLL